MTPAEKTRLLAERVMEWGFNEAKCESDGCRFSFRLASDNYPIWSALWSPLTNLAHAGEVLEAMRAKGWIGRILAEPDTNIVEFYEASGPRRVFTDDAVLPTAICHAALMTTGVKEEEL